MSTQKKKWAEELQKSFTPKGRTQDVPLSLIIPTYNSGMMLGKTLTSIKRQNYSPLEVIVVDAGSTDQTLGICAQFGPLIKRVYSVATYNLSEMINRGVALATGHYLSVIYPGSFYINDQAYDIFVEALIDSDFPDFIYSGFVGRDEEMRGDDFSLKTMKRGFFPTTFGACWIKTDFFLKLGKLNPNYHVRFMFDLLARIVLFPQKTVKRLDRKLVYFDITQFLSKAQELAQLSETWKILKKSFGVKVALKWFFTLRFVLLTKLLWRILKGKVFE